MRLFSKFLIILVFVGLQFIIYFTAKSAKIAKDSVGLALRPSRSLRCIIT